MAAERYDVGSIHLSSVEGIRGDVITVGSIRLRPVGGIQASGVNSCGGVPGNLRLIPPAPVFGMVIAVAVMSKVRRLQLQPRSPAGLERLPGSQGWVEIGLNCFNWVELQEAVSRFQSSGFVVWSFWQSAEGSSRLK